MPRYPENKKRRLAKLREKKQAYTQHRVLDFFTLVAICAANVTYKSKHLLLFVVITASLVIPWFTIITSSAAATTASERVTVCLEGSSPASRCGCMADGRGLISKVLALRGGDGGGRDRSGIRTGGVDSTAEPHSSAPTTLASDDSLLLAGALSRAAESRVGAIPLRPREGKVG